MLEPGGAIERGDPMGYGWVRGSVSKRTERRSRRSTTGPLRRKMAAARKSAPPIAPRRDLRRASPIGIQNFVERSIAGLARALAAPGFLVQPSAAFDE
jgi:hypothetical protein